METYSFDKYIDQNIRYPGPELRDGITGVVIVSFRVNTDHRATDIKIVNNPNENLIKSVITVLEKAPATFAKNAGQVYAIPFYFEVTVQDNHKIPDETGIKEILSKLTAARIIVLKKVNVRGFFYADYR
ncbi:TonB family protein [Mucilaginibacter sp. UR6-11]|uniref:TonB family protein n=1 Tax=Mucilaginibacter sp. UR6-11 TaxID=1435644 RepID=UPI001E3FE124|nr:TonB family protein [Mucilaginibacter sp. UR6-11]